MPLKVQLTTEEKVRITLDPRTPAGKPAKLDPSNPPKWSVETGDATLDVAPDGLSAYIISPDTAGVSQVLVDGDADLGDGVEDVSDFITVEVSGAKARSLGLAAEPPVLKE
jgi:hypothetical protein